jgi:hypothetical protein
MLRFRRALNHLEVKEIELTGHKFTWSNGQQNPTLSRIDRACCYPHWEDLFPNPILQALSSSISITPTFYKNKIFVQIGVHIKMCIKL